MKFLDGTILGTFSYNNVSLCVDVRLDLNNSFT